VKPQYSEGELVRVIRNVRNDGTFPGSEIGDMLIRRGSMGHVRNIGTFLQDQIIYSVYFIDEDIMVGCREEELIGGDDPWVPSRYEFRDKVVSKIPLAINGEIIVEEGAEAEVLKVLRDLPGGVQYHVRFPGRTLQVPEAALEFANKADSDEEACQDATEGSE
jgi:nitrogen fixation protein NifZ